MNFVLTQRTYREAALGSEGVRTKVKYKVADWNVPVASTDYGFKVKEEEEERERGCLIVTLGKRRQLFQSM